MKQPKELANQDRREFIKKSTLLGAGVATASVVATEAIADIGPPDPQPGDEGYHLTQHILDYYKSADL